MNREKLKKDLELLKTPEQMLNYCINNFDFNFQIKKDIQLKLKEGLLIAYDLLFIANKQKIDKYQFSKDLELLKTPEQMLLYLIHNFDLNTNLGFIVKPTFVTALIKTFDLLTPKQKNK